MRSVAVDMDNTNVSPPVLRNGDPSEMVCPRPFLTLPNPGAQQLIKNNIVHAMKTSTAQREQIQGRSPFVGVVDFFYRGRRRRLYKHQGKGTRVGGRGGKRAGRLHPDQRRYTDSTTIAVCKTRPNTRAHHHRRFSGLLPGLTLWWFRPTKSEKRGGNEEGTAYRYL